MTKVEIDGKTYCVETLIHEVERLKKEVKASAEVHKITLDKIRAEIEKLPTDYCGGYVGLDKQEILQIIDKYK